MTENIQCCEHPRSVLRHRVNRGGVPYAVTQCASCGFYGSKGYRAVGKKDWPARIKTIEQLPKFDEEAFARASAAINDKEMRDAIKERGNPHAQANKLKLLRDDLERRERERAERAPYYASPEWDLMRRRVMKRAGGLCEGCGQVPPAEVHHMTYEHFGAEFMWELRAVCKPCHERYHAPHRARDEAIRRGELPYEGPVGPIMQQIVDGIEPLADDEEDAA